MRIKLFCFSLLLLSLSCNSEHKSFDNSVFDTKKDTNVKEVSYARGFEIKNIENSKLITIHDPWQGAEKIVYKYLLVNKGDSIPDIEADFVIETPVKRVICLSTTHIAFIDVLNETNTIFGVSGKNYVNNTKIRQRIENNEVLDVGYDNSLNYELITSLNPDLVITYGVGGQVAGYNQKLNDLGIKTIINAEYLENHPLGKLEWIKFIAALYNKDKQADEYFEKVENEYLELLSLTDTIKNRPYVLFGLPWKEVWYVPGGNSYLSKMVTDAGGNYIWKNNESRESTPFSIETMFSLASKTDIWLNAGAVNNKIDIIKIDSRFKDFKPFNKCKIYNNNKHLNAFGGNDYWETGLVEPQVVLKDLMRIFHPELLPKHKLVYYKLIE